MIPKPSKSDINLYVIRHTQTPIDRDGRSHGWIDIPLDEKGVSQAKAMSRAMSTIPLDQVHSSDMTRARQTAEILGRGEPQSSPALRPINTGDLAGQTHEQLEAQAKPIEKMWQKDPTVRMPNGESIKDYQDRNIPYIQQVVSSMSPGQSAAIVGHSITAGLFDAMSKHGTIAPISGSDIGKAHQSEGQPTVTAYRFNPQQGLRKAGSWDVHHGKDAGVERTKSAFSRLEAK